MGAGVFSRSLFYILGLGNVNEHNVSKVFAAILLQFDV